MDNRSQLPKPALLRRAWQPLCMALGAITLAVALSGCVIVPARTYYHPYHYGYGY
jgi:hypothetical protein